MMCVIKIFQNTKWCVSWYKVSNIWLCNYETKTSRCCIMKHTQHHFWFFLIIWNIIFWMQQHLQYRKDEVWQYSHDSKISWFSSELFGKVASYLQDRWLAFIKRTMALNTTTVSFWTGAVDCQQQPTLIITDFRYYFSYLVELGCCC